MQKSGFRLTSFLFFRIFIIYDQITARLPLRGQIVPYGGRADVGIGPYGTEPR